MGQSKTIGLVTLIASTGLLAAGMYPAISSETNLNNGISAITFNSTEILSYLKDGEYLLTIQNGNISVRPSGIAPTPGPTPGPSPMPNPNLSLEDTVKKNMPASYPNLDQDRRAMAFGMEFLRTAVAASPDVNKSRQIVKQFCDEAVSPNQAKWGDFWAVVSGKLDSMQLTPQTYQSALSEIAATLTEDLPQASVVDSDGQKTFGLSPELINFLMKVLLPLLLELLKGLQ